MTQPIQKIAVPIDFSSFSKAAVSYAAVLAKFFNAAMVLVNVIDQRGLDRFKRFSCGTGAFNGECFERERTAERMKRLSAIAAELEKQGLRIETHVLVDIPFRGILKCVAQSKSDFLVTVTKGRTNAAEVLVGSCAEKLFRRSPVPVLSIPAAFITTHEGRNGESLAFIKKSKSACLSGNKCTATIDRLYGLHHGL
jgi:nucleotide-binding universal stress UspA family protein